MNLFKLFLILSLGIFFPNLSFSGDKSSQEICLYPGEKIKINNSTILVRNACTEKDAVNGLMYVKEMAENGGMLFIFGEEKILNFWMKNTYIPLDIAYINNNLEIVDIQTMKPHDLTLILSKYPASYALEVNAGFFKKNNINVGDKLKF